MISQVARGDPFLGNLIFRRGDKRMKRVPFSTKKWVKKENRRGESHVKENIFGEARNELQGLLRRRKKSPK